MPTVYLGNTAALDRGEPLPGDRVTILVIPDGATVAEVLATVTDERDGAWKAHGAAAPAWVECDDEPTATAISDHYGCPTGRPEDWGMKE